jgi:hypothetical protein
MPLIGSIQSTIKISRDVNMKKNISTIAVLVSLMLALFTATDCCWAKIFKYKDKNGVWHFSDTPVQLPENFEKTTESGGIPDSVLLNSISDYYTQGLIKKILTVFFDEMWSFKLRATTKFVWGG